VTEPPPALRVAIVDDHPMFRMGLSAALADMDGIELVGQAERAEEVEPLVEATPPVSGGQSPEGTETQVKGPWVSVNANWWCSNWTGTLVAVPAVPPELRFATVAV